MFNNHDQLLYVFSLGSQVYRRYDLSRFLNWSPLFDFIPFGTDFVLFNDFGYGKQLYKYDLANGTFVPIKTQPSISFNTCAGSWAIGYPRSFWRFGFSRLVAVCTIAPSPQPYHAIYGIYVLHVDTLTLDKVAESTGSVDGGGLPPWYRLAAGQDKQIYLQPSFIEYNHTGLIPVWRRSIQDTAWTALSLSERGLVGWDTGRFADHPSLYADVLTVESGPDAYQVEEIEVLTPSPTP